MNKEERLQTLDGVLDRMIGKIDDAAPIDFDTAEFQMLIRNTADLISLFYDVKHAWDHITLNKADSWEFTVDKPGEEVHSTDVAEPEPAETPAPEPVPEPVEQTYLTLEEMRAKLADLINQFDVDVPGIMTGMGFAKLSEVPKERYQELLDAAEAAKGA